MCHQVFCHALTVNKICLFVWPSESIWYASRVSKVVETKRLTSKQADCVFPTRTARFGVALTFKGPMNLSMSSPISSNCYITHYVFFQGPLNMPLISNP